MDANILVQGLLGGLVFALAGWAISKIGGRSKEKMIAELGGNFSEEKLSVKQKTAIMLLFMRIAECDSNLNKKEYALIQAILSILDYNPNEKESETFGTKMEEYSIKELVDVLHDMNLSQKEWFVKTSKALANSDSEISQQEKDFLLPIFNQMNINENLYSEMK